ncbi:putative MFS transporter [Lophiotrema nucula]|uniref:Putative MFS transporter n=1 Tax=Lophiotrema nucula TaxID=690887 RepID=A0A6A5ZJ15_9PLEO|nr:putative MFS transporter [Lophiotrema nucula]
MGSVKGTTELISHTPRSIHPLDLKALDEALAFLETHQEHASTDEVTLRSIRRKVDWHIFPILSCCQLVQSLDKYALNYAAVMGLPKDLDLHGNDFTIVATAFFVAYILSELPNIYLLQRVPAAKWLSLNIFLWAIATACAAATTSFSTLLIVRILLGIFEATTLPSCQAITAQYFTKEEAAPRYAYWAFGSGGAAVFGGLFSFAFQFMENGKLAGWRAMFVVFGALTLVVGAATWYWVPDTPMEAHFLTDVEKVSLLKHVSVNKTGIRSQNFKIEEVWEALLDPQIWIFAVATICLASSSGIISTYSATLIRSMGFTSKQAALLNMPGGIVGLITVLCAATAVRHTKGGRRWLYISVCALVATLGASLTSFLPNKPNHSFSRSRKAGALIGIYLINSITATLPLVYHYVSVNISGHTKRSFAANLIALCFGLGNIIGPMMFQAKDAPDYLPAKIGTMATEAGTAVCMWVLVGYYWWENRRRDRLQMVVGEGEEVAGGLGAVDEENWKGLTDRRNGRWRYMY